MRVFPEPDSECPYTREEGARIDGVCGLQGLRPKRGKNRLKITRSCGVRHTWLYGTRYVGIVHAIPTYEIRDT